MVPGAAPSLSPNSQYRRAVCARNRNITEFKGVKRLRVALQAGIRRRPEIRHIAAAIAGKLVAQPHLVIARQRHAVKSESHSPRTSVHRPSLSSTRSPSSNSNLQAQSGCWSRSECPARRSTRGRQRESRYRRCASRLFPTSTRSPSGRSANLSRCPLSSTLPFRKLSVCGIGDDRRQRGAESSGGGVILTAARRLGRSRPGGLHA